MMEELVERFLALPRLGKIDVLARVAHEETIRAREAYIPWEGPIDGQTLRSSNERLHRLAACIGAVSRGRTTSDVDISFMRMVIEVFGQQGCGRLEQLTVWLRQASALHDAASPEQASKL